MKITTLVRTFAAAAMLVATTAGAQNILDNPYFNAGLTSWSPSDPSRATWTNTMDYHVEGGEPFGSADLDSHNGMAFIAQCVPIDQLTYVGTVWVYSGCVGQSLNIFWADDACTASFDGMAAQSTVTGAWQQLTAVGTPTLTSSHAVVVLLNPSACGNTAFFDVAALQPDYVFANGFEVAL